MQRGGFATLTEADAALQDLRMVLAVSDCNLLSDGGTAIT